MYGTRTWTDHACGAVSRPAASWFTCHDGIACIRYPRPTKLESAIRIQGMYRMWKAKRRMLKRLRKTYHKECVAPCACASPVTALT